MKISGAEIIARTLRAHDVDLLPTLVGDHILPLCDRLPDHGIRIVDVRQDAAAVHMADGYARSSGRTGVCATTGGPGLANAIAGLGTAHLAESPVVHLAGMQDLATDGMGNPQEVDQVALTSPVTKASRIVRDVRRLPTAIADAFRMSASLRQGPIHLTIPLDVQSATVDEKEVAIARPVALAPAPAAQADLAKVVAILKGASRPVVIAGSALRAHVQPKMLRRFFEASGLPLFTTELVRGVLDDGHPLSLGYPDPILNDAGAMISRADVVVLLGKAQDYRVGYARPPFVSGDAQIIQVDPDPAQIARHRAVACAIVVDPGAVVDQLAAVAEEIAWPDWSGWVGELQSARAGSRDRLDRLAVDDETPLHPLRALRALRQILPEDAAYVFDAGDFGLWGRAFFSARRLGRWMRTGPMGQLGAALPLAMGCQLAIGDAPVACIIGDGGVGFHLMELDTAVRHAIPVVVVVGNDAAWGVDRHFQIAYYGRAVATDLRPLRYDRLAAELGAYAEFAERPEDLGAAFQRAVASRRPAL
ncbi:MAG: hypothetical protein A2W26_07050, partial [Acidobacteria bacterium RBG_16_64_8]